MSHVSRVYNLNKEMTSSLPSLPVMLYLRATEELECNNFEKVRIRDRLNLRWFWELKGMCCHDPIKILGEWFPRWRWCEVSEKGAARAWESAERKGVGVGGVGGKGREEGALGVWPAKDENHCLRGLYIAEQALFSFRCQFLRDFVVSFSLISLTIPWSI